MTEPAEQLPGREWGAYCGIGLIILALVLAPFWCSWTVSAFYPKPSQIDEAMSKPWRPFARLALSSFMTVFMLVIGGLLIRMQYRRK